MAARLSAARPYRVSSLSFFRLSARPFAPALMRRLSSRCCRSERVITASSACSIKARNTPRVASTASASLLAEERTFSAWAAASTYFRATRNCSVSCLSFSCFNPLPSFSCSESSPGTDAARSWCAVEAVPATSASFFVKDAPHGIPCSSSSWMAFRESMLCEISSTCFLISIDIRCARSERCSRPGSSSCWARSSCSEIE